jgi:hypothetical protein
MIYSSYICSLFSLSPHNVDLRNYCHHYDFCKRITNNKERSNVQTFIEIKRKKYFNFLISFLKYWLPFLFLDGTGVLFHYVIT